MKAITYIGVVLLLWMTGVNAWAQEAGVSDETEECLTCHTMLHPGLVASWRKSLHSTTSPAQGLEKPEMERRISSKSVPEKLGDTVVGCYECHSLRSEVHADSFEHNGYTINIVVTPSDCATCHSVEAEQFSRNMMSHAHGNLVDNEVYQDFMGVVNGRYSYSEGELAIAKSDRQTEYESCLYCHGTRLQVRGRVSRDTDFGEMEFPELEGWPNQGVGRINPDGSKGACTACHTRHAFSIAEARKPHTCSECHKGPDVPAYKVYEVSKHGTIFKTKHMDFNFTAVPWKVGEDFTVPTCAACHASLLTSPDGEVIAKRTHRFNDRLAWRLFGVPYPHPHPRSADLSDVVNSAGLPLPVELDGQPVSRFVIDESEQQKRNERLQAVCLSCHGRQWVESHFARLENTIDETIHQTQVATGILSDVWAGGFEQGLPQGANIFDQQAERMWTTVWLFYTNSTRFASAMAGGGDYGVFAKGRYQTGMELNSLFQRLELYRKLSPQKSGNGK